MGHADHDHGGSTRKLALVAAVNLVGFLAEFAGGLLFGSVALLSDAVHMLFDAIAYGMALAAAVVAEHYEGSDRWSYGLHRLEPLSAFLNGALLIPMVGYVLYESYRRFLTPTDIVAGPTLALALGGLAVNLLSVWVLRGDEMSLNERGAFYHLLGDAGGSVAVVVSTVVVEVTGVRVVDPLTAVLVAALVLWSAGKVLAGSTVIFLQRSPVDRETVESRLLDVAGVRSVEDFHAWQICSRITVATVHASAAAESADDVAAVTERVHDALRECGVDHATVEVRPAGRAGDRAARHRH